MTLTIPTDLRIGGKDVPAADERRFDVLDPATGEVIATVADADVADAISAIDAADHAAASWAATAPRERAEILRRAFELMTAAAEDLAMLISQENGKALPDARGEVAYAAEFFRWYSEEAVRIGGSLSTAPSGTNQIVVTHEPVGICVLVTPWNFPAAMATRKIGPALAAGCTMVLKPASDTPLTALAMVAILEDAGVPPGVVNVVTSRRSGKVVSAMLHDDRVRKLSFTGSTEVGRVLAARGVRSDRELFDGTGWQRAVPRLRRCRPRRCGGWRDDRQDAQRRRGLHGRQPVLRRGTDRRRVRPSPGGADGGHGGRSRARTSTVRSAR